MRVAYADPPYLGLCAVYEHDHGADGRCWDDEATHAALIARLLSEFDGWALSLQVPALRTMLNCCPDDVRVGAWVKPFASFKKHVNPAYAWEPVLFKPARRPVGDTVRDWVAASITLRRGFVGAKPVRFCRWLFEALGLEPDDVFVDLFPGSGAVGAAHREWLFDRRYEQGGFVLTGG